MHEHEHEHGSDSGGGNVFELVALVGCAAVLALALRIIVDTVVDHEDRLGELAGRVQVLETSGVSHGSA